MALNNNNNRLNVNPQRSYCHSAGNIFRACNISRGGKFCRGGRFFRAGRTSRAETPYLPGTPRIRSPGLRTPPSTVPNDLTRLPLAIPEWMATRLPRKGGYPLTRGGLLFFPRIFRRHQHLPFGCQPWSPECSTRFSQSLYDHAGLFRKP